MKKAIRIILVLSVVGLISGASLVFVYKYAAPLIAENQKEETKKAIFNVLPGAASYEEVKKKGVDVYLVKDKDGKELGYAFEAEGNGYQGKIKLMVGIQSDLTTLTGIEVLESQETPGLGQEIDSGNFKKQFEGLKASPGIEYVKGKKPDKPNQIEAITGATISSKAVVNIISKEIEDIREALKKGK